MSATDEERLHCVALTQVAGIGLVGAKRLIDAMGSAADVFRCREELPGRLGVSERVVSALASPQPLERAEREMEFMRRKGVRCLTLGDEEYPSRLRECADAPVALFFKGDADLNALRVVSIVGTRRATAYGVQLCGTFLCDLKTLCPDTLIVSGLAYGVDICAHREALANGFPTVGVLAHGLDRIYPSAHRKTAVDMLERGGLLTEFLTGTEPDRYNFVSRNRIVAGMCDAVIVVESAEKGGSLITAEIAEGYHRDCFAFPGRVDDEYSKGCNRLIRDNKASLLLSADDFVEAMMWKKASVPEERKHVQRSLFPDLSDEERQVVDILEKRGEQQINSLVVAANIPVQRMSALLFELEMKGVVRALAGGMYQLL